MNNDVGWGSESDHGTWDAAGSTALLITAGLYWSAVWLLSGLAPLPSLASRALWRSARTRLLTPPAEEHTFR